MPRPLQHHTWQVMVLRTIVLECAVIQFINYYADRINDDDLRQNNQKTFNSKPSGRSGTVVEWLASRNGKARKSHAYRELYEIGQRVLHVRGTIKFDDKSVQVFGEEVD